MMRVKIKNFMSIKDVVVEFPKSSFVIVGENLDEGGSNGSGKSALIEAIFWCLYGETFRGTQKSLIRKGEKMMNVSIETDEFSLVRSLSLSGINEVVLERNGKRVIGASNVSKFIEESYGVFDDFVLVNYFSDIHRFSKLTETQRKEVVSRFIDLGLVDKLLEKVKEKEKEIMLERKALDIKLMSLERFISETSRRLSELENELKKKPEKVDKKKVDEYNALKLRIDGLRKEYGLINYEYKKLLKEFGSLDKKVCPVCLRPFLKDEEFREVKSKYDKKESELKDKLSKIVSELEKLEKKFNDEFKDFDLQEYLRKLEYQAKYKELLKLKDDLSKDVEYKKIEFNQLKIDKDKFDELLDVCVFFKNKLGWKGVKSMLLESFLGALEERLNYYFDELGLSYVVSFNVVPSEKGVERLKVLMTDISGERELELLSQGERRKFDICFMLAINDFLPRKLRFKYLFFDEALDGLDIQSIYKVIDLLKKTERDFVLISHLLLDFKLPVVKVIKRNGISLVNS